MGRSAMIKGDPMDQRNLTLPVSVWKILEGLFPGMTANSMARRAVLNHLESLGKLTSETRMKIEESERASMARKAKKRRKYKAEHKETLIERAACSAELAEQMASELYPDVEGQP